MFSSCVPFWAWYIQCLPTKILSSFKLAQKNYHTIPSPHMYNICMCELVLSSTPCRPLPNPLNHPHTHTHVCTLPHFLVLCLGDKVQCGTKMVKKKNRHLRQSGRWQAQKGKLFVTNHPVGNYKRVVIKIIELSWILLQDIITTGLQSVKFIADWK